MALVKGLDIFDAVYIYVRESYIKNIYSKKIKDHTTNETIDESENLLMNKTAEPASEINKNTKEKSVSYTENVSESVARMTEAEVGDKIRMDIDEKMQFALASVCSNLATIDKEYRLLKGLHDQIPFSEYIIKHSDEFPLSDRFVFPAIMYVSSMVLIDIDEKRSDDYYDKYASSVSQIISELPNKRYSIAEEYPY